LPAIGTAAMCSISDIAVASVVEADVNQSAVHTYTLHRYSVNEFILVQKLLEELENLEVPADIREARLESLKHEAAQFAAMHEKKHGQYTYAGFCLFLLIYAFIEMT